MKSSHCFLNLFVSIVFFTFSHVSVATNDNCHATYSVIDGYGQFFLPCVESANGKTYQATLNQVQNIEQFLFALELKETTSLPSGTYASFDNNTNSLSIPSVEVSLGGQKAFYELQMSAIETLVVTSNLVLGITSTSNWNSKNLWEFLLLILPLKT